MVWANAFTPVCDDKSYVAYDPRVFYEKRTKLQPTAVCVIAKWTLAG